MCFGSGGASPSAPNNTPAYQPEDAYTAVAKEVKPVADTSTTTKPQDPGTMQVPPSSTASGLGGM